MREHELAFAGRRRLDDLGFVDLDEDIVESIFMADLRALALDFLAQGSERRQCGGARGGSSQGTTRMTAAQMIRLWTTFSLLSLWRMRLSTIFRTSLKRRRRQAQV